jgi:hypothetical protein
MLPKMLVHRGLCVLVVLVSVVKVQAADAKPEWLGSTAGIDDRVLAPFTPVDVAASGEVGVWGRKHRFDRLPFPTSIIARDAELLGGPITLQGTAGGKPIAWTGSPGQWIDKRPQRATFKTLATADGLRCEGTLAIEYDGMMRSDFRIVPTGAIRVERLDLEIPLAAKHARYVHTWPGRWGSAGNSAALPADGLAIPFKPMVWLGDEWRGLCWFSETDRNLFVEAKQPAIEIRRKGDAVVLQVHLIAQPRTLDQALDYTFGFQATPVKPAQPDAWDYRICHRGSYGVEPQLDKMAAAGVRTMVIHEHWTDIQAYPTTTHGEKLKKLVKACHDHGMKLLVYFGYEMSNIAPEWDEWGPKCLVAPRAGGYKRKPEQTAYIVCYRSAWQDFIAHGMQKALRDYDLDGVYLDGTSEPWGCANTQHGCGWTRPDGKVSPTYSFFATRSMMKRIYTLVKAHRPDGQVNVHQSTCMTIPTLAFATSYWDGEQLQSVKRPGFAQDLLPLDAFRCEFMGHNWGVPAELLWYKSGAFARNEALSVALLHDVPVRPIDDEALTASSRLWKTFDEFGRHESAWLPYWENERYVTAEPAAVKASIYNRPGKGCLVVLANMGRAACRAKVRLDVQALQQPAALHARDVLADRDVGLADGRLESELPAMDFQVLRLTPR